MSPANPLLPAVLAQPEDDAVRLICADWYEENGDEDRGRFIRAQCELARLPEWDRRRQELTWLADDLEARHGARWRAELPVLRGIAWADFERGFVSTVRVHEVEALYSHDAAVAAAAPVYRAELVGLGKDGKDRPRGSVPWMRAVRLSAYRDLRQAIGATFLRGVAEVELVNFPQHANLDWLISQADEAALTSLKIEGEHVVGRSFARALARSRRFRRLTRLGLGTRFVDYNSGYFEDPTLGADGARDLVGSSHLGPLAALDLGRQRIGLDGLRAVLASPRLRGLHELVLRSNEIASIEEFRSSPGDGMSLLDLSDNPIGDGGAAALAESPRLAGLASLGLDTCEVTGHGIRALAVAPFWATLCRLDLSRNPLGERGAWNLAETAPPARLHTLRLCDCDLDAAAAEVIAAVPWLPGVQTLDLSRNRLGKGCAGILERLAHGALRALSLADTGLPPGGLYPLAPLWPKLVSLDLTGNEVGAGLGELAAAGPARALQMLRLHRGRLFRASLEALAAPGAYPSLHILVLSGMTLEAAALRSLLQSPLAGRLRDLDLSRCGLGDEAAHLLARTPAVAGLGRLNLRLNTFGEKALVALAESPHLFAVPQVLLTGSPWSYSQATQRLLADRFGPGWYYREEDEEDQDEGGDE
jgi:uncharacterized protein (TIGR02996 family)